MNEPMTSGMPPSVEGIVTRPSPFDVESHTDGSEFRDFTAKPLDEANKTAHYGGSSLCHWCPDASTRQDNAMLIGERHSDMRST